MPFGKCIRGLIATDIVAGVILFFRYFSSRIGVDSYIGGLMRTRLIEEKSALEKSVSD